MEWRYVQWRKFAYLYLQFHSETNSPEAGQTGFTLAAIALFSCLTNLLANHLTGDAGADKFQISQQHDYSTIHDFTSGTDHIQFKGTTLGITSYSDLTIADDAFGNAHITSAIDPSDDFDITVLGVSASTLTSSDFLYV